MTLTSFPPAAIEPQAESDGYPNELDTELNPSWQCAVERRSLSAGANPAQQLSLRLVAARAVHGGDDMGAPFSIHGTCRARHTPSGNWLGSGAKHGAASPAPSRPETTRRDRKGKDGLVWI